MQMKRWTTKRVLVLLALTIGALAGTTAAQAQVVTNKTVSYAYSGYVSCANGGAGELVNGTVDVHNLVTEIVNGNVDRWQFQFQPHGSMVGSVTGDTYQLTGMTQGTYKHSLQDDASTMTYVETYQLIGPGPGNNLRVRELAHITRHGDEIIVDHDNWTIECT
jgi:hypothetical protein